MPAIPYNDTAVVDQPWDGPGNEARIKTPVVARSAKLWTWYDDKAPDPDGEGWPDAKSAYKLPHHEVDANGNVGAANVRGVRAALGRLEQTKGIPSSDFAAIRSHLQKHLDKFNAGKKGSVEVEIELGFSAGDFMLEAAGRVWAIRPEVMAALGDLDGRQVSDRALAELQAARSKGNGGPQVYGNGVAVVPLQGMITPQASLLALLFGVGGGGLMGFRDQLRQAANNPDVSHVVLNVDSPGGLVDQVPEVAAEIRQAREAKPIVAVANTMAASAAYWLASQAHEVVVTPSGEIGSIGVYQLHKDVSQALAGAGIKPTLIHAGKYKVEGNPYEPLSSDALQSAQQGVDDYYGMFLKDVAAGRGVDVPHVEENYGQGRTMTAQRAVRAGLADRVATLEQTISRLSSGRAKVRRTSADDGQPEESLDVTEIEADAEIVYTAEEKERMLATLAGIR